MQCWKSPGKCGSCRHLVDTTRNPCQCGEDDRLLLLLCSVLEHQRRGADHTTLAKGHESSDSKSAPLTTHQMAETSWDRKSSAFHICQKKLGSCICSKLPDSEFHSIRLSQTVSDSSNGLPSPLLRNRIHSGCTVPMTQCHLKLFPTSPSTDTCQVSKPAPPSASIHRCNRPVTLWLMQQRLLEQLIIEIGWGLLRDKGRSGT